jgi:hypothetical protein
MQGQKFAVAKSPLATKNGKGETNIKNGHPRCDLKSGKL